MIRGVTAALEALIAEGRAALQAGDAAGARRSFEVALEHEDSGTVVEGLARASYLELDHAAAIEQWERAYALHRDAGDRLGAVRVARMLGYMHGTVLGEPAVMRGWLARAHRMLGDKTQCARERLGVTRCRPVLEPDRARQEELYETTIEIGRKFGDADLEFVALAYLGASLVRADRTDAGMAMLDESLAAVAGDELDDFISAQEIFCQLFMACEHAHDVSRADQWIRIGIGIAERRRLPGVAAFCNTHYGGILTVAGRWTEADVALTEAIGQWDLGHRALRGGALARLAGLRVLQGRFEEAEQLLEGLDGRVTRRPRWRPCISLPAGPPSRATSSSGRWSRRAPRAAMPRHCSRCWSKLTSLPGPSRRRPRPRIASRHAPRGIRATTSPRSPHSPTGRSASRPARATHSPPFAKPSRASCGPRCPWRWRECDSQSPACLRRTAGRSPRPRPVPRWRRSRCSTRSDRRMPPRRCCVPSACG